MRRHDQTDDEAIPVIIGEEVKAEIFRFGTSVANKGTMAIYNEFGDRVADFIDDEYREVDSDGNKVPNGRIFIYTSEEGDAPERLAVRRHDQTDAQATDVTLGAYYMAPDKDLGDLDQPEHESENEELEPDISSEEVVATSPTSTRKPTFHLNKHGLQMLKNGTWKWVASNVKGALVAKGDKNFTYFFDEKGDLYFKHNRTGETTLATQKENISIDGADPSKFPEPKTRSAGFATKALKVATDVAVAPLRLVGIVKDNRKNNTTTITEQHGLAAAIYGLGGLFSGFLFPLFPEVSGWQRPTVASSEALGTLGAAGPIFASMAVGLMGTTLALARRKILIDHPDLIKEKVKAPEKAKEPKKEKGKGAEVAPVVVAAPAPPVVVPVAAPAPAPPVPPVEEPKPRPAPKPAARPKDYSEVPVEDLKAIREVLGGQWKPVRTDGELRYVREGGVEDIEAKVDGIRDKLKGVKGGTDFNTGKFGVHAEGNKVELYSKFGPDGEAELKRAMKAVAELTSNELYAKKNPKLSKQEATVVKEVFGSPWKKETRPETNEVYYKNNAVDDADKTTAALKALTRLLYARDDLGATSLETTTAVKTKDGVELVGNEVEWGMLALEEKGILKTKITTAPPVIPPDRVPANDLDGIKAAKVPLPEYLAKFKWELKGLSGIEGAGKDIKSDRVKNKPYSKLALVFEGNEADKLAVKQALEETYGLIVRDIDYFGAGKAKDYMQTGDKEKRSFGITFDMTDKAKIEDLIKATNNIAAAKIGDGWKDKVDAGSARLAVKLGTGFAESRSRT